MENTTTKAAAGLQAKLAAVKSQLKLGKDAQNTFGGYAYRNAEVMLARINPALAEAGATIDFSDEITMIGDRYYVRTTLTAHDTATGEAYSVTAYAREQAVKKGMDEAQISGSAMTYAHKYALMGMFAIADPKADPDAHDNRNDGQPQGVVYDAPQAPAYYDPAPAYYDAAPAPAYYDAAPAQAQPYAARSDELPDGVYDGARLVRLEETTTKKGAAAVAIEFDVNGARARRTLTHGYGRVGRLLESLGCAGMTVEQAAAEAQGYTYRIEKRRDERNPKYYELEVLAITG